MSASVHPIPSNITEIHDIIPWDNLDCQFNDSCVEHLSHISERNDSPRNDNSSAAFAILPSLNSKIAIWNGPIWKLRVDAIVNTTNESLTDRTGIAGKIMEAAGTEIDLECAASDKCRTGAAVSTRGCRLPSKRIIHTVGPRFNEKYRNAAENALHGCYRSSMSVAKEEKLRTVAFGCVYTKRKQYPREEAAHVALRTIRRFLEHHGEDFDQIILCPDESRDYEIYKRLLKIYFPRTEEELQFSVENLPSNLGDEYGEPILEDRKIRISPFPHSEEVGDGNQQEYNENQCEELFIEERNPMVHDFTEMVSDPDQERIEKLCKDTSNGSSSNEQLIKSSSKYQRYLNKARSQDLHDVSSLNLIYRAGVDHDGNAVIAYIGKHLPAVKVDLERVLLYIVRFMDDYAHQRFSVVYVHSAVKDENLPDLKWLKQLFQTFASKSRENLIHFYVIGPTLSLKMVLWIIKSIVEDSFYKKILYRDYANHIKHISVKLPDFAYKEERPTADQIIPRQSL